MFPELLKTVERGTDKYGSGAFGASRGNRKHNGIDLSCAVISPVNGKVTKLGYPYGDDLAFRYVEITDAKGYRVRLFYVSPEVEEETSVIKGQIVGMLQSLQRRYQGITDHVHLEIIAPNGNYISWGAYDKEKDKGRV